jgi:hypothetical protein
VTASASLAMAQGAGGAAQAAMPEPITAGAIKKSAGQVRPHARVERFARAAEERITPAPCRPPRLPR